MVEADLAASEQQGDEGGKDVHNVEVGVSIRLSVSVIILIYFFR